MTQPHEIFGRTVTLAEALQPPSWTIPLLVPDVGMSALGIVDPAIREVAAIQIARSLRGDRSVRVLGVFGESVRALDCVVLLVTSKARALRYRRAFGNDEGVRVVALRPWSTNDGSYFPSLRTEVASAGAVLVDNVNGIQAGASVPAGLGREVADIHPTVVALLVGNANGSVGVNGGSQLWDEADTRYYLGPKNDKLVAVDDPNGRFAVPQVPALADVSVAQSTQAITEAQVHQLGQAGRWLSKQGGANARAGTLLTDALAAVRTICGREPSQSELAAAIERHRDAFALGEAGKPLDCESPIDDDAPPF